MPAGQQEVTVIMRLGIKVESLEMSDFSRAGALRDINDHLLLDHRKWWLPSVTASGGWAPAFVICFGNNRRRRGSCGNFPVVIAI